MLAATWCAVRGLPDDSARRRECVRKDRIKSTVYNSAMADAPPADEPSADEPSADHPVADEPAAAGDANLSTGAKRAPIVPSKAAHEGPNILQQLQMKQMERIQLSVQFLTQPGVRSEPKENKEKYLKNEL